MNTYHKIQTLFERDPETNFKTLLEGEFARPEFEYLKDNEWIFTEKVDGMNIRVLWNGDHVTFQGKMDKAQLPGDLVEELDRTFTETMNEVFPHSGVEEDNVCLYGEGYGGKIQKGGASYGVDKRFVLFDVKINSLWLSRGNVMDIAQKLGAEIIPVIAFGSLETMVELVKEGIDSCWGDFQVEGLVGRPTTELRTRRGERVITKLKCKDFRGQE